MNPKPFWKSKTFIVNAVVGILSAVAVFVPKVKELLPAEHATEAVGGLIAFANVVLRFVTKDPVTIS